jgi:hypothetical protein
MKDLGRQAGRGARLRGVPTRSVQARKRAQTEGRRSRGGGGGARATTFFRPNRVLGRRRRGGGTLGAHGRKDGSIAPVPSSPARVHATATTLGVCFIDPYQKSTELLIDRVRGASRCVCLCFLSSAEMVGVHC